MIIFASEDAGCDPRALQVAINVDLAVERVGMPEGKIALAQGAVYLACCAKSNASYMAMREMEKLIAENPDSAFAVQADAADEGAVVQAVDAAVKRFGSIQVMVVNHGIWSETDTPLWRMSLEQWNRTMAVDLTGAFLFAREYLKQLDGIDDEMRNLSLIFVGSTAGRFGEALHADYATAKAGLMYGLTRSLKNEVHVLHPRIRVNSVMPGWTRTPMAADALKDKKTVDRVVATIPLKKIALPEDVAASILLLASESLSGHITGQIMEVSGGMEGRILHPPK